MVQNTAYLNSTVLHVQLRLQRQNETVHVITDKLFRSQTVQSNDYSALRRILADTFNQQLHVGVARELAISDTDVDNIITNVETLHSAQCAVNFIYVEETSVLISGNRKREVICRIVIKSVDTADDAAGEDIIASDSDSSRQWCYDGWRTAPLHNQHCDVHVRVEWRSSVVKDTHCQLVLVLPLAAEAGR